MDSSTLGPHVRSIIRIILGLTFSCHGCQKILGLLGGMKQPMFSLGWFAGMLELVGGILIIVGLGTRVTAFILSGEMAVAYFHTHAPRGFWPIKNGGELAVVYCFVFLYLAAAGGGVWSLDHLLHGDKSSSK